MTGQIAHPLMTDHVRFVTNEMVRVLRLCLDRVRARRSAVIFEGCSRVGKSNCSVFVTETLTLKFPKAHVTRCVARTRTNTRVNVLYNEICFAEEALPKSARIDLLFHLVGCIESHLAQYVDKQYVLVIDEIDRLNSLDFRQLADLHNYLQSADIKLTVIGFSQSEIYDKRSSFKTVEQHQIVARFLSEIIPIYGCRNVSDVAIVLRACDEGSEFPVGTHISYTAYFLPKAFANGFRLATLADVFWRLFAESVSGRYVNNLPMEHLRESIANYMVQAQAHDGVLLDINEEDVRCAVHNTNIRTFCDAV